MRRTLEMLFRYWAQFAALLAIPTVIAFAIAWAQPRQYEASATLWAIQRYYVIGATGPETDLNSTPAATQATAVTELLQTRSFDLAVAKETTLASTFGATTRADPNKLDDAIQQELSTKVTVTPTGYDLFQIIYDNKDPKVAEQVVAATVDQFGVIATGYSSIEARQLIQMYQTQLGTAKKNSNAASQAAATYLTSHPLANPQNDPTYSQLYQQAQAAQANVANIESNITQLDQQLALVASGSSGLYEVIDPSRANSKPISRVKTLALGGGIGAGVGLLAITLLLVTLMRRDRSAYTPDDLARMTALPVALELPALTPAFITATMQTYRALPKRT